MSTFKTEVLCLVNNVQLRVVKHLLLYNERQISFLAVTHDVLRY